MPVDAGQQMKARLRADLVVAMKDRRTAEAKVIRSLVAALDNAEAPPMTPEPMSLSQHQFGTGSAEIERLILDESQVRDALLAELQERERAAAEMDRLQQTDRADALRAEAQVVKRYLS